MVSNGGMTDSTSRRRSRWQLVWETLRLLAIAGALFLLYYILPIDGLGSLPIGVTLSVGLAILIVVGVWQIRAVVRADHPSVRAIEMLAGFVPLYLVLFATAYYSFARVYPESFSDAMTRTDALYFTVTVFSTVGFGDISPVGQAARGAVIVQIILNLILLGAGVRVLTMAVKVGNVRHSPAPSASPGRHGSEPEPPSFSTYRLVLRGELDDDLASTFERMRITRESGMTVLIGPVRDQAHLGEIFDRAQRMGAEIISISQEDGPVRPEK